MIKAMPIVATVSTNRGARAKRVLALGALDVLDDLLHRGLPHVQVSRTLQVVGLNFERLVHVALRVVALMAMAARI